MIDQPLLKRYLKKLDKHSGEFITKKQIHLLHTQKFQYLSSNLIRHKIQFQLPIEDDVPSKLIPLIQNYYQHIEPLSKKDWFNDLVSFSKDKGALHPEWFSFEEAVYENILTLSGLNTRHVQALSLALQDYIKNKYGLVPKHVEGEALSQWIVLDYHFLIIHIFYDYLRSYYQLEDFWKKKSLPKR